MVIQDMAAVRKASEGFPNTNYLVPTSIFREDFSRTIHSLNIISFFANRR